MDDYLDERVRIELGFGTNEKLSIEEHLGEREARKNFTIFNPKTRKDVKKTFSPDSFFRIKVGDKFMSCFLELDRGNQDHRKKIRRKIYNYLDFSTSGAYKKLYGGKVFRTLFVIEPRWGNKDITSKRLQNLKALAEEMKANFVWLTTLPELQEKGFFKATWYKAGEKNPQPFLPK